MLVGATGFDAATRGTLETAARTIPVLIAPNTSIGVAVMTHLLEVAARALGGGYDAEISEVHHRMKRDAPSGTALAWGEAIARARGADLKQLAVFDRQGNTGARVPGSIGFASLRTGDVVGEHTAVLAADGERLELTHRAQDRMVFARGALAAAAWLLGRPAGTLRHAKRAGILMCGAFATIAWTLGARIANIRARKSLDRIIKAGGRS